jgi:hypothetical protein
MAELSSAALAALWAAHKIIGGQNNSGDGIGDFDVKV